MKNLDNPFKLDSEQKTIWLNALRSGKYLQGKGQLQFEGINSYCCLGVFQEVCSIENRDGCYLPHKVIPDSIQIDLATMNDSGKSFEEIANYIEINL